MLKYLILFILASILSFFLTPLVRSVSRKLGVLDIPDERKIHKNPTPRWGGIPIFVAFNIGIFISVWFDFFHLPFSFLKGINYNLLFAGSLLVIGLGAIDDIRRVPVFLKFLFQIIAAIFVVVAFPRIEAINFPFGTIYLGGWSILITILWVVTITNAVNLLDGLDGLAAGTSFIVCIALFGISLLNQNIGIALVSIILAGSILGFLKYNFYPASVFLGDSGAYFLGFILSVLSLISGFKGTTTFAILVPILALGLPIMDTILSMFRRLLKSLHIMEVDQSRNIVKFFYLNGWSMFRADKNHIHHRLLQIGLTQKRAVIALYTISLALGALALSSVYFKNINHALLITSIAVATYIGVRKLGYHEIQVLSNGVLLPIFDMPMVNRRILRVFVDMAIISFSYYFAFVLRFEGDFSLTKDYLLTTLPLVLATKTIIFHFSGLYKGAWRYTDISDLMRMVKGVILGCAASALLLWLIPGFGVTSRAVLLIDFNLLLFFVIGARSSFRILEHLHSSKNHQGKNVLIYGVGKSGVSALREFINNPLLILNPIGFIDDDLRNKGKQVNGYPVLGTLDTLESLLKKNSISEVILSITDISQEKIDKLSHICLSYQVLLRRFQTRLEDLAPSPRN